MWERAVTAWTSARPPCWAGPGAGYSPPHLGRQYSGSAQASWCRTHGITGAQWADARTGCGSHALQAKKGAAGPQT